MCNVTVNKLCRELYIEICTSSELSTFGAQRRRTHDPLFQAIWFSPCGSVAIKLQGKQDTSNRQVACKSIALFYLFAGEKTITTPSAPDTGPQHQRLSSLNVHSHKLQGCRNLPNCLRNAKTENIRDPPCSKQVDGSPGHLHFVSR